jgi:hypothetical protein
VSHSSTEAEIKAIDELIRCIIHVRDILEFLGNKQHDPSIIYVDNLSAIELCKTLKSSSTMKHINIRINFIRECINARIITLVFIPTHLNVADMLTKPLPDETFNLHKQKLMRGFNGDIRSISPEEVFVVEHINADNE